MVHIKKGTTPNKNQQQLKKGKATPSKNVPAVDMDDSDDSDEAPQLQKTPQNKGAKARQSMSEKKVSFSIPAKSPAKTPKKDNSAVGKKQSTPGSKGKTALQEFKGMKGKQAQADADEDSDDDDEDDDDFEIDEDDDDIEVDMDEDDDDDDDEVDDEEDDDDDDDDDDEDEESVKQQLSALKEKSSKKEQAKNDKSPVKSPKQKTEKDSKVQGEILQDDAERKRQRNARMLFVGKLPNDVTEQELKALSKDIVEVSIPMANRKQPAKTLYAFISFETEAKAVANYKSLQTKKFRGQPLTIDYVGEKSANNKPEDSKQGLNLKKLFVSGLAVDATLDQVAKHFKKAFQITFNISSAFRTATVSFLTEEDAKEAYDNSKDIAVGGHNLTVLYSRQTPAAEHKTKRRNRGKRSRKDSQNGGGPKNAKKMKMSKAE